MGGSEAFAKSQLLGEVLKKQESSGRFIATICAASCALLTHKIGYGRSITSYPAVKEQLTNDFNYVDDQPVVHDGQFLTSRGPGTAMIFALKLVELLVSKEKAQEASKAMLLNSDYKLD